MNKQEITAQLTELNIAFDPNAHHLSLKKLLNDSVKALESNQSEVNTQNQLIDLISTLSQSVTKLSQEVQELKSGQQTPALTIASSAPPTDFLKTVPADLLIEAQKILGDKFLFECTPATDKPFFDFVVIVPPEYSIFPPDVQDRRTRMISNSLGVDGVASWCKLVRENIIKTLGKQLPI